MRSSSERSEPRLPPQNLLVLHATDRFVPFDSLEMRIFLAFPLLALGTLFTGCEAIVEDRRPVVQHRYDHGRPYYQGRSSYYDDGVSYRSGSTFRSDYYDRPSRSGYTYGGYERTRSRDYYSPSAPTATVRRTEVNNVYVKKDARHSPPPKKKQREKKDKHDHD